MRLGHEEKVIAFLQRALEIYPEYSNIREALLDIQN